MKRIIPLSATPWLASVCPTIHAVDSVAAASVAAWGKVSRSAAEIATAQAALNWSARERGESGFGAARPMFAYDQLTRLVPNGGLCGPQPWRDPVRT